MGRWHLSWSSSDYIRERLLELAEGLETVSIKDEVMVFGGFLVPEHPEDQLGILVRRPHEVAFREVHYSRVHEFRQAWEEARMWVEYWDVSPEECEWWDKCEEDWGAYICDACGSRDFPVSGDEVYFGYVGCPVCPECKKEAMSRDRVRGLTVIIAKEQLQRMIDDPFGENHDKDRE